MTSQPYVEYGGRTTAPPPFRSQGGRLRGFVLAGDRARIDALIDRVFNVPAAGAVEYRPLGGHVLLLIGAFARIASQAPAFEKVGYIRETQASLWVPLAAGHRDDDGAFVGDRLCVAVPYIFVDNPMSFAGGREDYGYPKSLGRFDPADGLGDTVSVEAFGGNFGTDVQAGWHTLIEVSQTGAADEAARLAGEAASGAKLAWRAATELPAHVLKLVRDAADEPTSPAGGLRRLLDDLVHRRATQVFLKQFRDAGAADRACYQAIVEAPVSISRASWHPSLHAWQVTIHHLDSDPIAEELGVTSQTTRLTYELEIDMTAEPGAVVAVPG